MLTDVGVGALAEPALELDRVHGDSRPTNAPRTATAAGVTPGIRSAWPRVSGRTCASR